jgi:hypothetical protein
LISLSEAGIPQSWLLGVLHDYADPGLRQEAHLRHRAVALPSVKAIDRTLKILNKASTALESFAKIDGVPEWVRYHRADLRLRLFEILKSYRHAMDDVRAELAGLASAKGEGASEELLAGLVEAVTGVTGTPHWGDLAYLVEATYFAHNRRFHADRDTIRKKYNRFVENFPRIQESWAGLDWKQFFDLGEHIEQPSSRDPQAQMDHLIRRFGNRSTNHKIRPARYRKIHKSMKR